MAESANRVTKHFFKYASNTLTSMAHLIECHPKKQKVAGSIPSQGACLGCGPSLWLGVCERQQVDISLTH